MNGKGDKPRPVNKNKYDKNYQSIFNNMKFYEVKQQLNNLQWLSLGYTKKIEDAKTLESLYNTKHVVYPTKIVEHEFFSAKDIKELGE